ncbi:MAG TPA: acyl-CoA thioesterase [Trebonia sp.]|nr:acyl-CoA thioesterase [Trebonia sp.]
MKAIIQVRVTDLDAAGHVSSPRLIELLITAHYQLLTPVGWVIRRQDLCYHRPVTAEVTRVAVHTTPARVGRTSLTLRSAMAHCDSTDLLYLESTTVWVYTDPVTRQPAPLPPAVISRTS